jgi:hypothetical protein
MSQIDPPVEGYPPAPWQTHGGAWIGLFHTDRALLLPPDLRPLLGDRRVVVALIRHLTGTLRYNEFIVGMYVRRGAVPGLYIQHIWVDNAASLWGGRRIWGLPKQLARFDWSGNTVAISAADAPIATVSIDPRTAYAPRIPMPVPILGCRERRWLLALALASARLGRASIRLHDWSARLPYRPDSTPLLAVAMKPFHLKIPAPVVIR